MIDLYFFPTPNTWKISIMLEEVGLDYKTVKVDTSKREQLEPEFLQINPNGKVPAIVDHGAAGGAQSVFESGAILIYLAEKAGRFLAPSGPRRVEALEWTFWQTSGLGPMAGQAHHFRRFHPEMIYAVERYVNEASRLYGVLDRHLEDREWIAGDYSIADIASWGWVWFHRMHDQTLADFPNVERWFLRMWERPAVRRGRMAGLDGIGADVPSRYDGPFWLPPEERGGV